MAIQVATSPEKKTEKENEEDDENAEHYLDAISKIAFPIVYFTVIGIYFLIEFTHH